MSSHHATHEFSRNVSEQSRAYHSTKRADFRQPRHGRVESAVSTLVAAAAVVVMVAYPLVTAAAATTAFGAFAAVRRTPTDGFPGGSLPMMGAGDGEPSDSVVGNG